MSDNPDDPSVDVLNREVSEGSCQDGSVGSGVGGSFVSLSGIGTLGDFDLLPVFT
jgi:hypothetical protein